MTRTFHCTLSTLAPVHLGTDEVYEPTGFVIDEQNREMAVFDPLDFIAALDPGERERLAAICKKGTVDSILELYRFYKGNLLAGLKAADRRVGICSGLLGKYKDVLSAKSGNARGISRQLNQFSIGRTAFQARDGRPYIPGSAVKGALRTAWLNAEKGKSRMHPKANQAREFEQDILGFERNRFENDPFRLVQVSDFRPVGEAPTKIMFAVNIKKKGGKGRGPYQILEMVKPGALFHGTITVREPEKDSKIRRPVDWDSLARATVSFYTHEKAREDAELAGIGARRIEVGANGGFLRVGRHSGAECLTIEGHRSIKIMTGKGSPNFYLDHAVTLWLASEEDAPKHMGSLLPFGWVSLVAGGTELESECRDMEEQWQAEQKEASTTPGKGDGPAPDSAPRSPGTVHPSPLSRKRDTGTPVEVLVLSERPKGGFNVQEEGRPQGALNLGTPPDPLPQVGDRITVYVQDDAKAPVYQWDQPSSGKKKGGMSGGPGKKGGKGYGPSKSRKR